MAYTFIVDRCRDYPAAVACKTMGVSTSEFYSWRPNPVRARTDAMSGNSIFDIQVASQCSYGSSRVYAELPLGDG